MQKSESSNPNNINPILCPDCNGDTDKRCLHGSAAERARLALTILDEEKAKAAERKRARLPVSCQEGSGEAYDRAGEQFGVSGSTVRRLEKKLSGKGSSRSSKRKTTQIGGCLVEKAIQHSVKQCGCDRCLGQFGRADVSIEAVDANTMVITITLPNAKTAEQAIEDALSGLAREWDKNPPYRELGCRTDESDFWITKGGAANDTHGRGQHGLCTMAQRDEIARLCRKYKLGLDNDQVDNMIGQYYYERVLEIPGLTPPIEEGSAAA